MGDPRIAACHARARGHAIRANAVTRRFRTCAGEVIGFMSNNHIDPELTTEVFVFEPLPSPNANRRFLS
jgi:hypothetical protein